MVELTTKKLAFGCLAFILILVFFLEWDVIMGERESCIVVEKQAPLDKEEEKACPPCTTSIVKSPTCAPCKDCSCPTCAPVPECNCESSCPDRKWVPMNLERFPMLSGPFQQKTNLNKSILFAAVGESGKAQIRKTIKLFPPSHFVYVFAVYDASDWRDEPFFKEVNWIYTVGQMRFWPMKRFLHPSVVPAYDSVWVLDEDVDLRFDPLEYIEKMKEHKVDFSMPANLNHGGPNWGITFKTKDDLLLRWTNFIECGPLWVASSRAWPYVWNLLNPEAVTGWGIDMIWCKWLSLNMPGFGSCAVFEAFPMFHLHQKSASGKSNYNPGAEVSMYSQLEGGKYGSPGYDTSGSIPLGDFKPRKFEA